MIALANGLFNLKIADESMRSSVHLDCLDLDLQLVEGFVKDPNRWPPTFDERVHVVAIGSVCKKTGTFSSG